ncbi:MAG: hypothetical protein PUA57_00115 [Eggerthellales bacterium]|nr:hypothetical protein [Eggerthellales bacterium]
MDFGQIYSFLFESMEGIAVLVVACLVLTGIIAAILEVRTRKVYKDRGPRKDEWELFDEDEEEAESASKD